MKKTPTAKEEDSDLLSEYQFDYSKAKPNRFGLAENQRGVILEPDAAEYFFDSESINRVLRALVEEKRKAAS